MDRLVDIMMDNDAAFEQIQHDISDRSPLVMSIQACLEEERVEELVIPEGYSNVRNLYQRKKMVYAQLEIEMVRIRTEIFKLAEQIDFYEEEYDGRN